ncbi:MAG: hypothetical protein ACK46G_09850 [Flavobacteriales bacterium]|jgi:hypothetical protein
MRTGLFAWLGALLFMLGCTAAEKPAPTPASGIRGSGPFAFPAIDDNLAHDTLLIQTTFDLGDMTYLMVASNVEETFEGLRLYRYRFAADSAVEMMAVSSPAYDSWTMLPTFFGADSTDTQALWVLANFGEKESWGQKLIWLERDFSDRGFMHVALPERVIEDDTLRLKRRNVAPQMRYSVQGDTSVWRFACDSVYLYDDQSGHLDQVLHASRLRYTFQASEGLALWVDGRKRLVKKPDMM